MTCGNVGIENLDNLLLYADCDYVPREYTLIACEMRQTSTSRYSLIFDRLLCMTYLNVLLRMKCRVCNIVLND